jgi:hypothetical protein
MASVQTAPNALAKGTLEQNKYFSISKGLNAPALGADDG